MSRREWKQFAAVMVLSMGGGLVGGAVGSIHGTPFVVTLFVALCFYWAGFLTAVK